MGKSSKKYTKSKETTKKAAPKTKAKLDTEIKKVVKGMAETKYNMTNAVINTQYHFFYSYYTVTQWCCTRCNRCNKNRIDDRCEIDRYSFTVL